MYFETVDLQWQNSTVSAPLNLRGTFQYVLLTNVQFDCYVHLGSATGEIYGEVLKGDIGSIRLPTDEISSIVLEAVNPNPNPNANGVYNGTFATLYLSDMPLRFDVTHRRPPIFLEQNKDSTDGSDSTKRPFVYISDDAPTVLAAMGLTSQYPGTVIVDHDTNRYTSRWGSLAQSNMHDYNIGAVGLWARSNAGNVFAIPADAANGLAVQVTNAPTVNIAGETVNIGTMPAVSISSLPTVSIGTNPAPTLRTKSYVAGFRNTGATADISTVLAIGANNLASITHDITSTKKLKIQNIKIAVQSISAAATITFELRKVNTNPTGGTNLINQHTVINYTNPYSFDAESTAMLLPTGIAYANSVMGDFLEWTTGATFANSGPIQLFDLYNISDGWGESPNIGAGEAGGWAIVAEASAAVTIKWQAIIRFTEE